MPLPGDTIGYFQVSQQVASVANNAPLIQIYNASVLGVGVPVRFMALLSLSIQLRTAVQSTFGLIQPVTKGTANVQADGELTYVTQSGSSGGFAAGRAATGWAVPPTFGATPYYEQVVLPASIGAAVQWSWPQEAPFNPLACFTPDPAFPTTDPRGIVIRNITGGACADVIVTSRWLAIAPF